MNTAFVVILLALVTGDVTFTVLKTKYFGDKFSKLEKKINTGVKPENLQATQEAFEEKIKSSDFELEEIHAKLATLEQSLLQSSDTEKIEILQKSFANYDEKLRNHKEAIQTILDYVQKEKLHERIEILEQQNQKLLNQIQELQEKWNQVAPSVAIEPEVITGTQIATHEENEVPQKGVIVTPDKAYVTSLKEKTSILKNILDERYYKGLIKTLDALLEDGDFDDPEEIMENIHNAISQNVFKSFSRVKVADIPTLEKFLKIAGYCPLNVKEGDSIIKFSEYFEQAFKENCTDETLSNQIMKIDVQPYQIFYDNDGIKDKLLLKGSCVFYGGNMT